MEIGPLDQWKARLGGLAFSMFEFGKCCDLVIMRIKL